MRIFYSFFFFENFSENFLSCRTDSVRYYCVGSYAIRCKSSEFHALEAGLLPKVWFRIRLMIQSVHTYMYELTSSNFTLSSPTTATTKAKNDTNISHLVYYSSHTSVFIHDINHSNARKVAEMWIFFVGLDPTACQKVDVKLPRI